MLYFTPTQREALIANRRQHALQHAIMASQYGQITIGNAAPLPKDVWGEWDRESVEIQRSILAVFNDLAGSVSTPMPIGKIVHFFRTVSDSGEVNITLDGRSKAVTDQQVYDYHGTPLPIVDSSFSYGWRQVAAAQTEGEPLEPDGRMNAMRRVAETLEDAALNGYASITVNGNASYGLRNHPKRGTRTTGETLNGATGVQWKAEMVATLKKLHDANFRAPATVYLNWDDWFYASSTDFSTQYPNKTILQRMMEIPGIQEIIPSNSVPASEIIAIIKRRDVLQILNGMPVSTRAKFRANPEDDYDFSTMAAAALEIKFDAEEQCGVAHSAPN